MQIKEGIGSGRPHPGASLGGFVNSAGQHDALARFSAGADRLPVVPNGVDEFFSPSIHADRLSALLGCGFAAQRSSRRCG